MTKILIVDDSAFMKQLIKGILNKANYNDIIQASTGQEAIQKYEDERPDLVLLDIILTRDMNGIDTLKQIRKINPKIKVVMVTVIDRPEVREAAEKIGIDGYINKPIHDKELIDVIKKILG